MDIQLGLESGTVRVVPHDARWARLYSEEAARIHDALGSVKLRVALEHTGSTAVPELHAKPIIDILGGWHHDGDRELLIAAIQELGYVHRGEQEIPGRDFFRRGNPRQYHLHLTKRRGAFWREHLAFRDLLRSDAAIADAYGALKQELARMHPRDRTAYIDGKTDFVLDSLRRARELGLYGDDEPRLRS